MHFKNIKHNFGKVPLCNLRAERAPHIGTFVFPLCWRCVGLLVGCVVATIIRLCVSIPSYPVIPIASCLPLLIDWTIQRLSIRESTNVRRFVTGIILALGQTFW